MKKIRLKLIALENLFYADAPGVVFRYCRIHPMMTPYVQCIKIPGFAFFWKCRDITIPPVIKKAQGWRKGDDNAHSKNISRKKYRIFQKLKIYQGASRSRPFATQSEMRRSAGEIRQFRYEPDMLCNYVTYHPCRVAHVQNKRIRCFWCPYALPERGA
jgi:hypothetical protein